MYNAHHLSETHMREHCSIDAGTYVDCLFHHCCFPNVRDVNFCGCIFQECNFSELDNADFTNCTFSTLRVQNVVRASFKYCRFESFTMVKGEINHAHVQKCTFVNSAFLTHSKIDTLIFFDNIFDRKMELSVRENEYVNPDAIYRVNNTIDFDFLPSNGFSAYKVAEYRDELTEEIKTAILTVYVPADVQCVCATGYKARAEKVVIVKAEDLDGNDLSPTHAFFSPFYGIQYKIGATVCADAFDPNPLVGCANGIHFFVSKKDALDYALEVG